MAPFGKRGDLIVHQQDPFNAEPPRAVLAASSLTASDAFYVRGHGRSPTATGPSGGCRSAAWSSMSST
jgi:sulfite oxidase